MFLFYLVCLKRNIGHETPHSHDFCWYNYKMELLSALWSFMCYKLSVTLRSPKVISRKEWQSDSCIKSMSTIWVQLVIPFECLSDWYLFTIFWSETRSISWRTWEIRDIFELGMIVWFSHHPNLGKVIMPFFYSLILFWTGVDHYNPIIFSS